MENIHIGGRYDENMEEPDNNIRHSTELIQDNQYYIHLHQDKEHGGGDNGLKPSDP